MAFTVQNVYGLLIRSKLLSVEDAKAMYERWLGESKGAVENVELFGRWMVAHHYVTEYQARLLLRGHTDGFFLNQYKILDRIGRGRMAGVYKAVHALGQVVAIKVLPPSKANDRHLLARFQREARLAMKLRHPNVVRAFQVAWASGLHYFVMEYLDGETLDDVLQRRKKLPPVEAVRLIYQTLLGLQHIHEQGLIHRDLKPSNLMLVPGRIPGQPDTTVNSTVKILDIGLGRQFFEDVNPASSSLEDPQLTGEGVLLGTPDYLAPEQARNARAVDIRADIYSLGCVLYHCLTGQPPFPDTNIITQMIRHATETPRPLKDLNPEVPDGLQQIVNWMMAKDPNQRYPTPERAAQALKVFLAAGMDAPAAAPVDAKLSSYLTWLEINNGFAAPAATPAAPPAAVPAASTKKLRASHSGKRSKKHKKHKKHKAAVAAPAAAPPGSGPTAAKPAAAPGGIDVELVPLVRKKKKRRREATPGQGITRRDFILLGIGGGAVLGAVGLGFLVAKIRDRFNRPGDTGELDDSGDLTADGAAKDAAAKDAPEKKDANGKDAMMKEGTKDAMMKEGGKDAMEKKDSQ